MDATVSEKLKILMSASSNLQACQTTEKYAETAKTNLVVLQKTATTETELMETAVAKTALLRTCGVAKMETQQLRTPAQISVEMEKLSIVFWDSETMATKLMKMVVTRIVL